MTASRIVTIQNRKGLHARAAAKFVKVVSSLDAAVKVQKLSSGLEEPSVPVNGTSILGLMMLGAEPGSRLQISAEGAQAQELVDAIEKLVNDRFGEEE